MRRAGAAHDRLAPVYNWSGIYFGVNGGYGFGKSDWTQAGASTGSFNTSGVAAAILSRGNCTIGHCGVPSHDEH